MAGWKWVGALLVGSLLVGSVVASGCNKPRRFTKTKEQNEQIQHAILQRDDPLLAKMQKIGADFDGRLKLLGAVVDKKSAKAGDILNIDWIWECVKPVEGSGWKIFVHFESPGKSRSTHDHQGVGELYAVKDWKAGQIIKDSQRITVQKDFPGGPAHFYVGLFDADAWTNNRENKRLPILNADELKISAGEKSDSRIKALTIAIDGPKAGAARPGVGDTKPRRYVARQAAVAPVIDGNLDDAAWKQTRPSEAFVSPSGERLQPNQLTQARVIWDAQNLYVAMSGVDDDIYNDQSGRDATLWKQDAMEIYLDPGADGKDYVEIQISPTGEIFDAHFTARRTPKWEDAAKALTINMTAKVAAEGSVNARGDGVTDKRWSIEVAIPWADLPGISGPPRAGETWGLNFYRIDVKSPTRAGWMSAWAPAGGDFHNTDAFGKVSFVAAVAGRPAIPQPQPQPQPQPPKPEAQPEAKPVAPEAKPVAPEAKPVAPEAKPVAPEAKPAAPKSP